MVRVIPKLQTYLLKFLNKKEEQSSKDVCTLYAVAQVRAEPRSRLGQFLGDTWRCPGKNSKPAEQGVDRSSSNCNGKLLPFSCQIL